MLRTRSTGCLSRCRVRYHPQHMAHSPTQTRKTHEGPPDMPLRACPLPQNRGQRRGTPDLVLTMPPVSPNVDKSHSRTHRQPRRLQCMGRTCNSLARSERRTNLLGTQPPDPGSARAPDVAGIQPPHPPTLGLGFPP
eukprot:3372053-Rhodomonas_salina.1